MGDGRGRQGVEFTEPPAITDPGDAGAIPVLQSGYVNLVSAGAETRTIAAPLFLGQQITLHFQTDGGNIVITFATAYDVFGTVIMTFADAGEFVNLRAVQDGSTLQWRVSDSEIKNILPDPGDAGAIPVTRNAVCNLVSAGAETRTIAAPNFEGQMLQLNMFTDGGDIVITVATTVNQTGNTSLTFADAGDHLLLQAGHNGSAIEWKVVANDGVALA